MSAPKETGVSGQIMIEKGPEGSVHLTLQTVFTPDDGPTISGVEMMGRRREPDDSLYWYLHYLTIWEEHIPDDWCFEGLTLTAGQVFDGYDGGRYLLCLEEDEAHPLKKWVLKYYNLKEQFGQGVRFLKVELH